MVVVAVPAQLMGLNGGVCEVGAVRRCAVVQCESLVPLVGSLFPADALVAPVVFLAAVQGVLRWQK